MKNNGHVDYLYRVAVRALIRNEKGQILVVKEKSHNWWRLPGGGLDYGESVKEGLKRELKEEVGLSGDFDYRIVVLEDASWNERLGAMQINAIFEVKAHTANFSLGTDGVDMAFESLDNIYLKNPAYSLIIATLKAMRDQFGNRKACLARELTKKFEEYIYGTLNELAELDEATLKGEMIIVVSGNQDEFQAKIGDDEIVRFIQSLTDVGISTKDAIKQASSVLKVHKNYIYKLMHRS
ncbi:MAG: NUDIX domain-containing protein [Methanomicrobia archaeon]|nr:NUDIX domain-containing protein [Methanomicrobia archaeon]